uniref:Ig-like domain-containing protein n=1 Tax=Scleropages formosus TaxID=113540 RepID=A0A8C9SNR5_SCLFO
VTVMNSLFLVGVPQSILNLQSGWTNMFHTETVTLRCDVQGSPTPWVYKWYRDGQEIPISGDGDTYTIPSAARSHSGQYECRGELPERAVTSPHSNSLLLTVYGDRPQAAVIQTPPGPLWFTGETVILTCDIRRTSGKWRYSWAMKNKQGALESLTPKSKEEQQTHTIQPVTESHSGEYLCQGERGKERVIQSLPGSVVLKVSGEKPKAEMKNVLPTGEVYTGDRLTLTCTVDGDSTGWKYLWYKDTQGVVLSNTDSDRTDGSSYTINSAAPSHSGQYWCRAHRGGFYSHYSDSHEVNIQGVPQPVLSLQSGWTNMFPTETVTLRCDFQESSTRWVYKWYRDGQEIPISGDGDTYTIPSAARSHSGQYQCRGELPERAVTSPHSNSLLLTVYGTVYVHSITVLDHLSSSRLWWSNPYPGDTGYTLDGLHTVELSNTDSDRTDGSSYTISSAAPSHSGQYWCRAHRGGFYSHYSDSHKVNIQGEDLMNNLPTKGLILKSESPVCCIVTAIFTFPVTLSCDVQGSSTRWVYKWYRDGQEIPISGDGDTYTILSAARSHSGQYQCRGELPERAVTSPHRLMGPVTPSALLLRPTVDSTGVELIEGSFTLTTVILIKSIFKVRDFILIAKLYIYFHVRILQSS